MKLRAGRVVAVVLLAAVATGCGASGTGDKGYVGGDGVITQLPAHERKGVGTLEGTTLDGKPWSLADQRGKVVVVNVWGSWCAPCRAEADKLAAAARQLASSPDVVFIGINTRDTSKDNAIAFDRRFAIDYPSIYDPSGETLLAFRGTITPQAIPSTLVIDPSGRIAARVLGEVPSTTTLLDLVHDAGATT